MGFSKFVVFCNHSSMMTGLKQRITVSFVQKRKAIKVEGVYEYISMGKEDMPLGKFLQGLGITLKDCEKALEGGE